MNGIILKLQKVNNENNENNETNETNETYASIEFILYNEYEEKYKEPRTVKILSVDSEGNQVGKFLFYLVIYCIVKCRCVSKIDLSNMTKNPEYAMKGIYKEFVPVNEEKMVYDINKFSLRNRILIFKEIKPIEIEPWSTTINTKLKNLITFLFNYNNMRDITKYKTLRQKSKRSKSRDKSRDQSRKKQKNKIE